MQGAFILLLLFVLCPQLTTNSENSISVSIGSLAVECVRRCRRHRLLAGWVVAAGDLWLWNGLRNCLCMRNKVCLRRGAEKKHGMKMELKIRAAWTCMAADTLHGVWVYLPCVLQQVFCKVKTMQPCDPFAAPKRGRMFSHKIHRIVRVKCVSVTRATRNNDCAASLLILCIFKSC